MLKVKDLMTKKVIAVSPKTKISEVAILLNKYKIHGAPVVKGKKLVGMITESDFFTKDFLSIHLPSYIEFLKKAKFAKGLSFKQKIESSKLLKAKAEDIMTKDCFFAETETEVDELIKVFKEKHIYTVPVINKIREVVGVVTLADIIKLIK